MMAATQRALIALGYEIRLATLSLKLDVLIADLERRYRPDQPRAPRGIAALFAEFSTAFEEFKATNDQRLRECPAWPPIRCRSRLVTSSGVI